MELTISPSAYLCAICFAVFSQFDHTFDDLACRIADNPDSGTDKGPSLRLSGVTISAASILHREEELLALTTCVPANPAARKR